ncbi:hypothetical protein [Pseudonocardia sp.]|uniref:hypothetical protein n=1 Tax=Pseudonocardia sp. TaxID=60912 RepID=UPI002633AA03|nr:hypothetical protein [Pseudonocardia sp.]
MARRSREVDMFRTWFAVVRSWLGTSVPVHHTYGACPPRHACPRSVRRERARTLLARRAGR